MPVTKRLIIILIPVVIIILIVIISLIVVLRPKNEAIEDLNGVWVVLGQQCPQDTVKINNAESVADLAFCIENFNLIDGDNINEYDAPPGCIRENGKIIFNLKSSGYDPQSNEINYYEFCRNSQYTEQTINPGCARQSEAQNVFNVEQLCCQDLGCTNPNDKSTYDAIHCFDDGTCNPVLLSNEQYRFAKSGEDSYMLQTCAIHENIYNQEKPQPLLTNAYNPYPETEPNNPPEVGAALNTPNNFLPNFYYQVALEQQVTYCIETPKTFYVYIDYLSLENVRVYGKDRSGILEFETQTTSTQLQFYNGDTVVFFVYNDFYLGNQQCHASNDCLLISSGLGAPSYTFTTVGTYYYGVEDFTKISGSILITPPEKLDSDTKEAHIGVIPIQTPQDPGPDEAGFIAELGGLIQGPRTIFSVIEETQGDLVSQKNPLASNLSLRKFNPSVDSDDNIEEFTKDEHGNIVGVRVVIQLINENGNCVSPGLPQRNTLNSEGWIQGSENLIDFELVELHCNDSLTIYDDSSLSNIVSNPIFIRGATYKFNFYYNELIKFAIYSHVTNENPAFNFSLNTETVTKNIFNQDFTFTYNLTSSNNSINVYKAFNDSDEYFDIPLSVSFVIDYPHLVKLKSYKITIDEEDSAPNNWFLQGSVDNSTFELIHQGINETIWSNGFNSYEIDDPGSYKYYKFVSKDTVQKRIKRIQFYENRMQDYREGVDHSHTSTSTITEIKIPYDAPPTIIYRSNISGNLKLGLIDVLDDAYNRPYYAIDDVYSDPQTGPMQPLNKVIDKSQIDPMKYRIELYEL